MDRRVGTLRLAKLATLETVIASEAKQSTSPRKRKNGLLRRGVYHRAGRRPDPLAPRNDVTDHAICGYKENIQIPDLAPLK
jgi:hypothetical protein